MGESYLLPTSRHVDHRHLGCLCWLTITWQIYQADALQLSLCSLNGCVSITIWADAFGIVCLVTCIAAMIVLLGCHLGCASWVDALVEREPLVSVGQGYRNLKFQPGLMMRDKRGGPLVPGEQTRTKRGARQGQKKYLKITGRPPHMRMSQATSHVIFHVKYTCAQVRRFELVTSSLARSFLTISPAQHI
jgi:hypothetical protein